MKSFTFALLATTLSSVVFGQSIFNSCATGTPPAQLTVSSFTLTPSPYLCVGQQFCAHISGVLSQALIDGQVTLTGEYVGNQVIYSSSASLCALTDCPVPDRDVNGLTICFDLDPSVQPDIPFQLTIQATAGNQETIFCETGVVVPSTC